MAGLKIEQFQKWNDDLYLITPAELRKLPVGTVLTSILGNIVTVGKDYIDEDTRLGYSAFGLRKEQIDPVCFVVKKLDKE